MPHRIRTALPTALILAAAAGAAFAAPAPLTAEFRLVAADSLPGWRRLAMPGDGGAWFAAPEVLLDQSAFAAASAVPGEGDAWIVDITMTAAGRAQLAAVTGAHLGEHLGMVVDGVLVTAPVIRSPITEGRAVLSGHFTADEARHIAAGVMAER